MGIMNKIKDHSLYLVISEECCMGRDALEIAERAIDGGVDIVQMREKNKPATELLRMAKKLSALCKYKGVLFIVNDDPLLAREADADGVHLGQEDMEKFPIKEARGIIGSDKIIGVSTHSIKQFIQANDGPADYLAFGPIFETRTKDYHIGVGDVEEVARMAKKPVFFIGGINFSNIGDLLKMGAKRIALIRGITEADNITLRTKEFKEALKY